jgi:hypothetical protein
MVSLRSSASPGNCRSTARAGGCVTLCPGHLPGRGPSLLDPGQLRRTDFVQDSPPAGRVPGHRSEQPGLIGQDAISLMHSAPSVTTSSPTRGPGHATSAVDALGPGHGYEWCLRARLQNDDANAICVGLTVMTTTGLQTVQVEEPSPRCVRWSNTTMI